MLTWSVPSCGPLHGRRAFLTLTWSVPGCGPLHLLASSRMACPSTSCTALDAVRRLLAPSCVLCSHLNNNGNA